MTHDPRNHSTENSISQTQFRLFQPGLDAIIGLNAQGQIVFLNRTTEELFQYPRNELLGQPAERLIPLRHRRRYLERSRINATDPWSAFGEPRMPFTARRKGGTEFPAEIVPDVLETTHESITLVVIRDLSAEHKWIGQTQQAQKMEALGRLASGIAHDFNNLLTIILADAEMALKDPQLKISTRKCLIDLNTAAAEAASLAGQLLQFGRKEMQDPTTVSVNILTGQMTRMLQRLVGENIAIEIIQHAEASRIRSEPSQIKKLVLNLVANARDAMPKGGQLTIDISNAEIESDPTHSSSKLPAGKYVVLKVADTGVGMDDETMSHLFEPFYTTKQRGTGLGLATVYGIVKQSKGEIFVSSRPAGGTTFTIFLPLVGESVAEAPIAVKSNTKLVGKGESLLVVEDTVSLRRCVCDFLKTCGFKVTEASDAGVAIRKIKTYRVPIDLLLTDIVMPITNGPELAKLLLHRDPEARVLFMTGYGEETLGDTGVQAGIPILKKPFSMDDLKRTVLGVLRKKSSRLRTT